MFEQTQASRASMLAFGALLLAGQHPARAQDTTPADAPALERVEITGSAIKRLDAETAVPVTTLRIEDLRREGITSVEQIVARLSAGQQTQGTSQSVGFLTGGASFANLRGLGQNKTLVLLNGRRLANNAIDSTAPDLNMIPLAALERVEVLRDGASALYGTDAIGGVINFITRKESVGGSASAGFESPQHPGGKSRDATLAFGFGSLAEDRYNLFGFIDYRKQDAIRGKQRPRLLERSPLASGVGAPGQYDQGGETQNPSFPDCGAPDGVPLGNGTTSANCGYLYGRQVDLVPASERKTGFLRGTLELPGRQLLSAEYFISNNLNTTTVAGNPYGALWMNPGTRYYPGNGITPLPTVFALDPNYQPPDGSPTGALPGGINVQWRDTFSGGRRDETDNTQQRFVTALEGAAGGWDYRGGLSYNENKLEHRLADGYTDSTIVTSGVLDGTINPFGPQNAAGEALLASAARRGVLFTGKGQVYALDGQANRELSDWFGAGAPAMLALGAEVRHEKYRFVANEDFAEQVVSSTGVDPTLDNRGSRTVQALYAELNVPVLRALEVTAALRHDRYSDFGGTTNPKYSFRYQPARQFLVRGSYSTGFRAPSLYDLYGPQTYTNTVSLQNDPIRCPGGNAIPGVPPSRNCQVQFLTLTGGNKALKPETSRNLTFGLVFEPTPDLNASIDFWWIRLKQQVGALSEEAIFNDPQRYADLFRRAPDGSLSTDLSQCPGPNCGYILEVTDNLGGVRTRGVDVNLSYRLKAGTAGDFGFGFSGTYVDTFEYQSEPGGAWANNLGLYGGGVDLTTRAGGPVFRWQHAMTVNWFRGAWGAGVVNQFKSHYVDATPPGTVSSHSTWDLYGTWKPNKSIVLTAGVRNVFDKEPPYSNQDRILQAGYDPRFADPTGRAYYLRGTYSF